MIAPPNTYAQWAALLTTFAAGTADEEAVHAMRAGTLVWQSGVAERFTQRLLDALNTRIQKDGDTFSRDLARASAEQDTIAALLAQRRRFSTRDSAPPLPPHPPPPHPRKQRPRAGRAAQGYCTGAARRGAPRLREAAGGDVAGRPLQ